MVTLSKWEIDYSTHSYRKSGDVKDLSYNVVTSEGVKYQFRPTPEGLHVFDIDPDNSNQVFGRKLVDNLTDKGNNMCHVGYSENDSDIDRDNGSTGVSNVDNKTTGVTGEEEPAIGIIKDSRKRFSKRDQVKANVVKRFQHVAGFPADFTLIYSVNTNSIKNNPITQRDIELSLEMLGPSRYIAQGKTTKTQPEGVDNTLRKIDIPRIIKQFFNNVVLSTNVMFLNDVPFLTTISEYIHYSTANAVDNLKCLLLEYQFKNVVRSYAIREFRIVMIMVDPQFKALKDRNLIGVPFNVASKEEYVHSIERWHRTIKERCQYYYTMILFKYLPRIIVVHLMITVMFYINAFVWKYGVSQVLPPLTIIEGTVLDYYLHFRIIYREFLQTYEGTDNTMSLRTSDIVGLRLNGNLQSRIRCYSLTSEHVLLRA